MRLSFLLLLFAFAIPNRSVFSQVDPEELLEVEGAIRIGNSAESYANPGTIRWSGSDFEGWKNGHWVSLTGIPFIKDIDNNRYEIITIGTQTWMAENLRTTRFNDGAEIDLVTDNASWSALSTPAYTWYENTSSDYGALYNHYVTTVSSNVCPHGWHVPTSSEWSLLSDYLGGSSVAGGKMKETGLEHWASPNIGANNFSGFSGLPGGLRTKLGPFSDVDDYGYWWSNTINLKGFPIYRILINSSEQLLYGSSLVRGSGMSIRCIKDQ